MKLIIKILVYLTIATLSSYLIWGSDWFQSQLTTQICGQIARGVGAASVIRIYPERFYENYSWCSQPYVITLRMYPRTGKTPTLDGHPIEDSLVHVYIIPIEDEGKNAVEEELE